MRALLRGLGWLAVLVTAGILISQSNAGHHTAQPLRIAPSLPIARRAGPHPPSADSAIVYSDRGFRSRERLVEHYRHHGRDIGATSIDDYLARAQELRDRPAGGPVLESARADGVITRFDKESGAFLAFDPDGTIRTFFRPAQGERYFRRQLTREHGAGSP